MRVISGTAKGIPLKTIDGDKTRPTTDKVKESMFNVIQFDIEGAMVLDLFAGSGALGIEALSRGAKEAVFVDKNRDAVRMIERNLKAAKLDKFSQVVFSSHLKFINSYRGTPFDIVFLDPPYDEEIVKDTINKLFTCNMMSDTAIIVCETRQEILPERFFNYIALKCYKYGKINVTVYVGEKTADNGL